MTGYRDSRPSRDPRSRLTWVWVAWHRLRGHWVEPVGWHGFYGDWHEEWRCIQCNTERHGWAPRWLRWKEQG